MKNSSQLYRTRGHTLWTALVALRDRENHLLKQGNDSPNRYPINSLLPRAVSLISTSLLTLYLTKRSFLVGVENNDFDSTGDKMEERGDHDDSPCI